jgi:hypothetical protein
MHISTTSFFILRSVPDYRLGSAAQIASPVLSLTNTDHTSASPREVLPSCIPCAPGLFFIVFRSWKVEGAGVNMFPCYQPACMTVPKFRLVGEAGKGLSVCRMHLDSKRSFCEKSGSTLKGQSSRSAAYSFSAQVLARTMDDRRTRAAGGRPPPPLYQQRTQSRSFRHS